MSASEHPAAEGAADRPAPPASPTAAAAVTGSPTAPAAPAGAVAGSPTEPPAAAPAEAGPAPTIWPAVVALGITVMGAGLVANLSVWTSQVNASLFLFGAAAFALGVGGWVRALRDEGRDER